jgi:molecular chaperone GrpE
VGTEFDVDKHEAVMRMPHDSDEGIIVQVVQKGYMIKDKVLRHAKVITSAGPQE